MSERRGARLSRGDASAAGAAPTGIRRAIDRLFAALGADPAFVEAVLGDLAEEHALRSARDGARAARTWYVQEALRSAPHLVASAVRYSSARTRVKFVAVAGVVAVIVAAMVAFDTAASVPTRLVVDTGSADGVIVNHIRPVRLPLRVLDTAGRELAGDSVRYRWESGTPLVLSPTGVATCTARGDATVLASLGQLTTRFIVHCRPVRDIRATSWNDFVVGGPPREWPVDFVGVDGLSVGLLSARVAIDDSSIARMDGLRIQPLAAGRAHLSVRVGDRSSGAAVRVFAEVPTLDSLRDDQTLVAVAVRLTPGRIVRWTLPIGLFSLVFLEGVETGQNGHAPAPLMSVSGPVMCLPALAPRVYNSRCLARAAGATLTVAHPGATARTVVGHVAMERERR